MPDDSKMPDKIFTVSELSRDIRFALEGKFREVWVEGEVSNLRTPGSGHQYFTLKDSSSQLNCVLFRMAAQRNRGVTLRDGAKVQVFGGITVYEARGQYQLVVQIIQTTGHGELQARFEALKKKLGSEGLFDSEKKKAIPPFPKTVAVVTSPSGAAIQDILNVVSRRAPWIRLIVVPVRVQGDGSEGEISRAIQFLSTRPDSLPVLDTIIVARGGGSIEDLWAFNDEAVARAIFDCPIPVVSGVGHEIDFTIADFVADRREPTPSAAAEASVPDGAALHHRLEVLAGRLDRWAQSVFQEQRRHIRSLHRELRAREPARKIENWAQSMDYLEDRLNRAVIHHLEQNRLRLSRHEVAVNSWNPEKAIVDGREQSQRVLAALYDSLDRNVAAKEEQLKRIQELLEAIGPDKTLQRGFSMTLDESGSPIFDAGELADGQVITTRYSKGETKSRIIQAGG